VRAAGVRTQRAPLRISASGGDYDLMICHAGHGMVAASLVAGVPLLLGPRYAEQEVTAIGVARLSAGRRVTPDAPSGALYAGLDELPLTNCRDSAAAFRTVHADYSATIAADRIAAPIDRALRGNEFKSAQRLLYVVEKSMTTGDCQCD